eukprot:CAMPEP_0183390558 /NCGR_PEP_ID=MMETSP0370-20130417/5792_1 /TAXON_ID=268820 /ORGANISM="Peridinium aciculiferum, Strain PAER-2" /LENGTH=49 /DNA_ID= /DNA_START= /DNA_END= /DNA_ORIENTATION=
MVAGSLVTSDFARVDQHLGTLLADNLDKALLLQVADGLTGHRAVDLQPL